MLNSELKVEQALYEDEYVTPSEIFRRPGKYGSLIFRNPKYIEKVRGAFFGDDDKRIYKLYNEAYHKSNKPISQRPRRVSLARLNASTRTLKISTHFVLAYIWYKKGCGHTVDSNIEELEECGCYRLFNEILRDAEFATERGGKGSHKRRIKHDN